VKFLKLSAAVAGSHLLDAATSAKPDAMEYINKNAITQQSVSSIPDRLAVYVKPV